MQTQRLPGQRRYSLFVSGVLVLVALLLVAWLLIGTTQKLPLALAVPCAPVFVACVPDPAPPAVPCASIFVPCTSAPVSPAHDAGMAGIAAISMERVTIGDVSFFVWKSATTVWVMGGSGGETKVMRTFVQLLSGRATHDSGDVLDVGANSGIYGLLAASYGFNTLLFDLQPQCHTWLRAAIHVNRLDALARVMPYAIGRTNTQQLSVSNATPCIGALRPSTATTFSAQTAGIDRASFYSVTTRRLDDVYTGVRRIMLIKIDTEGFEAEIITGMTRLLAEGRVDNVIVECSPVIWREFNMDRARVAAEIAALWDAGLTNVTFFLNQGESGADLLIESRGQLVDTLRFRSFSQNDILFRRPVGGDAT